MDAAALNGCQLIQPFIELLDHIFLCGLFLQLDHVILRGWLLPADSRRFNAVLAVEGIVGFVVVGFSPAVVFLPLHQQEGFGYLVADLHEYIFAVMWEIELSQVDRFHRLFLLTQKGQTA